MAMTPKKRKEIEKLIINFYDILDASGLNTKIWKKKFKELNDKQLEAFFRKMIADGDFMKFEMAAFDNETPYEKIKEAIEFCGGSMEEYIYYRDETTSDGAMVRSARPVPVMYLSVKRLQQILSKKNSYTFDASKRNAISNQVTGDDKIARNSDMESFALSVYGADNTLKELMGFRADNAKAKVSAYRDIAQKGYARLDELDTDVTQQSVVNLVDVNLIAAGMMSDLITPDLVLMNTVEEASRE